MKNAEIKEQLELKKREWQAQIAVCQSNISKLDETIKTIEVMGEPSSPDTGIVRLRDAVDFAIKGAPTEFSIKDIQEIIAIRFPSAKFSSGSITTTFWKIVMEQIGSSFEKAREGAGNQPTIYRKLA